ncbi:Clp protease ClpS [Neisseria arctica]|uniref:ATP-dependent Clp protease adapter protein ClpS n=1 Tax=Neisseria arctica TaxID=1470200 RepID=A0A0J0YQG4_9NEIS|nr:Clp protease ClpS [Neisseria arctica]
MRTSGQGTPQVKDADAKLTPPKKYGVFLVNDDYTPMDFVVKILTEVFLLAENRAVAIMLMVHHEGKGLCGVYTRDIAETKKQQVMQRARREEYPLMCTVEEV